VSESDSSTAYQSQFATEGEGVSAFEALLYWNPLTALLKFVRAVASDLSNMLVFNFSIGASLRLVWELAVSNRGVGMGATC